MTSTRVSESLSWMEESRDVSIACSPARRWEIERIETYFNTGVTLYARLWLSLYEIFDFHLYLTTGRMV
jgi:hypothetical protein